MILHALLIGIDHYLPPSSPEAFSFSDLGGAVRDIERMTGYLQEVLDVPDTHIRRLTSSIFFPTPEPNLPTYGNLLRAFEDLIERVQADDQVYIHYSGHGGRVPTALPADKGERGLDETLVPYDIADPRNRYLRDVELHALLARLAARGPWVTVVLDCCHAGGASRFQHGAGDLRVRGRGRVDTTERPTASNLGDWTDLATRWRRSLVRGPAALERCVILSACRASEEARERRIDGELSGLLTHHWLDSLLRAGPHTTYRQLHQRMLGQIQGLIHTQTPQLEGDADRRIFGSEQRKAAGLTVAVLDVEPLDGNRCNAVELRAGRAHGLTQGARFAIVDPEDPRRDRLAEVELDVLHGARSWARVVDTPKFRRPPAVGDDAVLLPGAIDLVKTVGRLVQPPPHHPLEDTTWEQIRSEITHRTEGFLRTADGEAATEQQQAPDLAVGLDTVGLDAAGTFLVLDAGGDPFELQPPLHVTTPGAVQDLVDRLDHLARYQHVRQLQHAPQGPDVLIDLEVKLVRLPETYELGDPIPPDLEWQAPEQAAPAQPGAWSCLRLQNHGQHIVHAAILILDADGSIRQMHPLDRPYEELEEAPFHLPMRAGLEDGRQLSRSTFKIFATLGDTDFRWLELPPSHRCHERRRQLRQSQPTSDLERLFQALTGQRRLRNQQETAHLDTDWAVQSFVLQVQR